MSQLSMPRRPSLKPTKIQGRQRPWMVSIPPTFSTSGKRERYFFETKADAQTYSEEQTIRIQNFGRAGNGIMSPVETEQAKHALESLRPYNTPLNYIVRDWITRKKAQEASVTFSIASAEYQAWLETRLIKGRPVSAAYKATVRQTLTRVSVLQNQLLSEVSAKEVAEACSDMPPSVKNTCLAVLSAFFEWAMQLPRHWMTANPTKSVPRESIGGKEVQTFTANQVQAVLSASTADDLLTYHILGFFAGIRPEELERVTWEHINLDEKVIVLPADVTKTRTRRVIEINETLEAWLRWILAQHGPKRGAIVSTVNLRKRLMALRATAEVKWIQDGMRHTYASNWLALHKDEHRLRDNLGHKSANELWDHYHKSTTLNEAKAFWAILPPEKMEKPKVIPFQGRVIA